MLDFTHHPVVVTSLSLKLTSTENGMAVAQYMKQHIRRFPKHVLFLNQRIILLMNVLFLIIQCHHHQSYLDA